MRVLTICWGFVLRKSQTASIDPTFGVWISSAGGRFFASLRMTAGGRGSTSAFSMFAAYEPSSV